MDWSNPRTLHLQNGTTKNDRWSIERTVDILCGKFLPPVHNAARMDNRRASARGRGVDRGFDRVFPVQPWDQVLTEADLGCRDCPAARRPPLSELVRKPFLRTSRLRDPSYPRLRPSRA